MAKTSKTTKEKKKRLVLLDAHAIIHRAYHALPDFTSATGEPTGALYGLSAMLLKIIQDLKPDYLAAAYDLPGPTYRHDAYDGYKAKRAKTEDALAVQIDRSRDVFAAFNIPIYEHPGFEADDMLGTIVEQVSKNKELDVIIASGDMDTMQLVSGKRVQVYTLKKGIKDTILYDEKGVEERFGFPPKLLPDYKGLRGDPSDNIIGIPGIGEKSATELIQAFGSIENMYKELKRGREKFTAAGIKPRIVELLENGKEEAEFSKMLATIRRDAPITFEMPEKPWCETLSTEKLLELFAELGFRTLSERVRELFMATASLGFPSAQAGEVSPEPAPEIVPPEELEKTAIALWLINSDISNPTLDDILQYARTKEFSRAKKMIFDELERQKLTRVFKDIEEPLIPVVRGMNERGVCIDRAFLENLSVEYHAELSKLEAEIYKAAEGEFNINSPKQLGEVLFDRLGLGVRNQKRTATGQRSTKESELEKLREQHPVIGTILAYRELQKLLSTYIDNIPKMVDAEGRLHATFVQAGTTTGRMSSQNPGLQNIPIRTDLGRKIRNAFTATEGFDLVALDYSQIELRVAAFLSGDEKMIEIFRGAGDVHRAVAAQVFAVPPEMVDAEMRRRAKVINFGILYGMGVNALRQNLGTTRAEAQTFYNEYFKNFSGIARYLDQVKAEAQRTGYTETYFGRRRHFEAMRSSLPYIRAQAERMAINAPIQGTEADIIKLAMVHIDTYLKEQGLEDDVHLLLQVHDELVYEIRKGKTEAVIPEIKRMMESVLTVEESRGVPIIVEAKLGKNWGEMEKLQ